MCTEKFLFCIVKNWKDIQRVLLRKKSAEKKPKSKIELSNHLNFYKWNFLECRIRHHQPRKITFL